MRDRTIESFRIILTILGLVLFVVYSGRATSASTDHKVSGTQRSVKVAATTALADLISTNANPIAFEASKASTRIVGRPAVSKSTVADQTTKHEAENLQHPVNTTHRKGNVVSDQAKQIKDAPHPPSKPVIAELPNESSNTHRPL